MCANPKKNSVSVINYLTRLLSYSFQVNLLNVKTSMNVNIFLKQFKCSNEGLVSVITGGRADQINATRLKGLLKILPEKEEVCHHQ